MKWFPFRYTCIWLHFRNLVFYEESTSDCPPGYQGHRCLRFCPYPQYGLKCTGKCECSVHLCHHINGCPPPGLWSFDKVYDNIFNINSKDFFFCVFIYFFNKTKRPINKAYKTQTCSMKRRYTLFSYIYILCYTRYSSITIYKHDLTLSHAYTGITIFSFFFHFFFRLKLLVC